MLVFIIVPSMEVEASQIYESYVDGDSEYILEPATNYFYAQTFTATSTHTVTSVMLYYYVGDRDPKSLYIELQTVDANHKPSGTVLSNGSSNAYGNYAWRNITLSPEVTLTNGVEYAIVMKVADDTGDIPDIVYNYSAGYSGGQMWENGTNGNWSSFTGDVYFKIWGDVPSYNIVYVDDDASAGWYDTSHVHTIQEGINNVSDGGIVYVWAGTYSEQVTVNKTITIIGNGTSTVLSSNSDWCMNLDSDSINISYMTFYNSPVYALYAADTKYHHIENCIFNNALNGIYLDTSNNNTIANCTFGNTTDEAIVLQNSPNNTITNCDFISNMYGISMGGHDGSNNNIITSCNFSNNDYGIEIQASSSNNDIYHNHFINNTIQAIDNGTNNQWDNDYPSGGNHWSDYIGTDGNGDGIGDIPYDISGTANSQDRYPLTSSAPESSSDVVVYNPESVGGYSAILKGGISDITSSTECGFWLIKGYSEPTFTESTVDINVTAGTFSSDTNFTYHILNLLSQYPYWVKAWAKTSTSFIVSSNTINFTTAGYSNMWDGLPRSTYGFRSSPDDFIVNNPSQGSPYYGSFCYESNQTENEGFSVTKWLSDGISNLTLSFYYTTSGNSLVKILYYSSTGTIGSETIYFNSSQFTWTFENYSATFSGVNKSLVRKVKIIFSSSSGDWLDIDNVIVNVDGWNTVYESFGDEWGYHYPSVYTLPSSYVDDITPYSANNLTGLNGGNGGDSNCTYGFKIWSNGGEVYWVNSDYWSVDTFYSNITNLTPNTKYYYCAFANNTAGQDLDTANTRNFTTYPVIYSPIYYFTTATIQLSNESPLNTSSNVSISPSGVNVSVNFTHPYTNGTMDIEWYYYDWDSSNFTLFATDTNVSTGNYQHLCPYFNESGLIYYWYVDVYEHNHENDSIHSTALYSFSSENFTISLENITPASGTTNLTYNSSGITTSVFLNYSFPSSQTFDLYWYWYNLTSGNWTLYGTDLNSNEGTYHHTCPMLFETMYWRVYAGNITLGVYNFSLFNYSGIQVVNVYPQRGAENVTLSSNGVETSVVIESTTTIPSDTSLNWYFYNWTSEGWELYASDNNIQSEHSYSHYLSYAQYGYISYYWRVDAEIFTIETFNFTSNLSIVPSNVIPATGSTVDILSNNTVKLQAEVNQISGKPFNLTFYFLQYTINETGYVTDSTWIPIANFTNVNNGTYYAYTPTQRYYPSLTYYWRLDAKETDNPLDPTIGLYNFTPSPETPSVWLVSPLNNSVNQSYDNINLTWNASDPNNDTLSYWVTIGLSPSDMYLVSLNQTEMYYNTGSLLPNTTYYWQIVVWDDKGWWNQSEIWNFTTEEMSYNYRVFLRNEEDFQLHQLDPNATYELVIYWKDEGRTETYFITSNSSNYFNFTEMPKLMRLYVYYPIYNSSNSSIIDGNGSYYRSRVPMSDDENITFWVAKYPQNIVQYVYTIDDKTANFAPPDAILRFYIYNETEGNIGIVDEDWINAENTLSVYLLYNSRYYLYVLSGQPPTVMYDAGFTDADSVQEKTIVVQPSAMIPLGWENIKYNAYKYGNNSIYIYFEDSLHLTTWVNITIYEYVNGTPYVLDNVNISTYKFIWIKTPVNLSRYHEVKFSFYHSKIGLQHSLNVGIPAISIEPLISYTIIDAIVTSILGANVFGWFASFLGAMVLVVTFTFSPKYQGLSVLATALLLILIVSIFGASALLPSSLLTFLLLIGVLQIYYERKREGGGL